MAQKKLKVIKKVKTVPKKRSAPSRGTQLSGNNPYLNSQPQSNMPGYQFGGSIY